jgi:hypothetical protein
MVARRMQEDCKSEVRRRREGRREERSRGRGGEEVTVEGERRMRGGEEAG